MKEGRSWFWNILAVITVIVCLVAFILHYKNWISTNNEGFRVMSGFYYQDIKFSDLDSVLIEERIPPMERLNGFSAFAKEKGVFREFKDSLTDKKYMFLPIILRTPK